MTDMTDPAPSRLSDDAWTTLPTPAKMAAWEQAAPGTAQRVLAMVESCQRHNQWLERWSLRIRMAGYVCALLSVGILAFVAKQCVDANAAGYAAAIMISGAVSIAGLFVTGRVITHRGRRPGSR